MTRHYGQRNGTIQVYDTGVSGIQGKHGRAVRHTVSDPKKNMDECITYILNEVQRSGCNGFNDDEIYSMAIHYYDEENIEVGNPINCRVVVNHTVELTEEEKREARQNALRQYGQEELKRLQNRHRPRTAAQTTANVQPTLFDF